jgi:phage terminase small subunit
MRYNLGHAEGRSGSKLDVAFGGIEMIGSTMLTARQQRFVEEYLCDLNAAAAYRRAGYAARGNAAEVNAARLLRNAQVAAEIERRKKHRAERVEVRAEDVLQRLWAIATADPREIIKVVTGPCPECWDDGEKHNSPNAACLRCWGQGSSRVIVSDLQKLSGPALALLARVKQTRHGVEVELHDQMAALEKVARHLGMFNDKLTVAGERENPLQLLLREIQGSALPVVASPDPN